MDPEQLIGQLIGGFLGGKKSRKRGGFGLPGLAGGFGSRRQGSGLLNAGTLLTVGGLIWGALETMQQSGAAGSATPTPVPPSTPPPSSPPRSVMSSGVPGAPVPPPLPPLPGAASASPTPEVPVPASLVPLVQLAVSAARADGELSDEELVVIRTRAAELGAAALVDAEIQARRSLDAITPAFTTPEQRQIAYALAYAVVHGESDVSPGERMYLTQLSRLLTLPSDDVERIERETLSGGDTR
jgi:uncharacterized membrane protein YebE (DUF533 family)